MEAVQEAEEADEASRDVEMRAESCEADER